MTLGDLLQSVDALPGRQPIGPVPDADSRALVVSQVTHDSRHVIPGSIFVGFKGRQTDGTAFATEAQHRGAVAAVSESARTAGVTIPWFIVEDARLALAALAACVHGHPSRGLMVVGITGTNGKTTTAYLLGSIFESAGVPCGRLGTIDHQIGSTRRAARLTTPEATDIQRYLRALVDAGTGACAMEVSSHALALKRVEYTSFTAAVFTNLTRDHLDFHGDMASYFSAKRRLFEMLPTGAPAVVNVDDPRGATLADAVAKPVTYAMARDASVQSGPVEASFAGLRFDARTPRGRLHIQSKLLGRVNVSNILAAVAVATALDFPFSAIERGVADLTMVPGRLQVVSEPTDDVTVIVDFAHTDDALRSVLETARSLSGGRLLTVFGCGGDRDRAKRPLMGAVAARFSDLVVVTSDNPRSEDPQAIIDQIMRGMTPPSSGSDVAPAKGTAAGYGTPYLTLVDRGAAIEQAIRDAHIGDVVLIAGKGHETHQLIADRVLPFDDAEVARAALEQRRTNSHVS